ncbi:MAG TPA: hypothetical protein VGV62_09280, partial [Xanthobacteraceae bacterium]|nr:hypothetical protein [Xanthobacteraceae bacterium]
SDGAHDRVLVEVAAPRDAPVDLFVEGSTPDWSLPLPQQTAADGAALTFTAISGEDAIEVTANLD